MALTKVTFNYPVNSSLQIGDKIYVSYIQITGPGLTPYQGTTSEPEYAGAAVDVGTDYIIIDKDPINLPSITPGDFILFAKSMSANKANVKGYYADITMTNSTSKKTELFAVSSEVMPSSK